MSSIIETPRLLLRPITLLDAKALYDLNADPDVIKYVGDSAFQNIDAAEEVIKNRILPQYDMYGFGRWAAIEKTSGAFIGWSGLKFLADLNEVDVGYRLYKKYWGQGFATESAKASLKFGFESKNLKRIIGRALKGNAASIKVLEKCGMTYCRTDFEHGEEARVYEMISADFKNSVQ